MTAWTRAQFDVRHADSIDQLPVVEDDEVVAVADGIDIWDSWPIRNTDGSIADVCGQVVWVALAAPTVGDPGLRHDIAEHRAFLLHDAGSFVDLGPLFPARAPLGSRQWAGSTLLDGGRLTAFYTATGPGFRQRLAAATATVDCVDGLPRFVDWSDHVEILQPDPERYDTADQSSGEPGLIKAFRDPFPFVDPASGEQYLFFTGSLSPASSDTDFNGAVGVARHCGDALDDWDLLDPVITADGVNNELERPHVVVHDGLYYLFISTQSRTFHPDVSAPTGLYGFVADDVLGPYRPLNEHGTVFVNPPSRPRQTYSWLVLNDLSVVGFVDAYLRHDERLPARRDLREVEAESVAYLVCAATGLDTADYSIPYLAGWSAGDPQLLEATAQHVLATASQMIATLEAELSIDLTPGTLHRTAAAGTEVINLNPDPKPSEATPLLDAATGETRAVMAGLIDETDRQHLLNALADLSQQLPVALDLCSSAGFTPQRTAHYLHTEHHIQPDVLLRAMIRDHLGHHPHAPDVPAHEQRQAASELRDTIDQLTHAPKHDNPAHEPSVLTQLSDGDRQLLTRLDLTNRQHLTHAVKLLADTGVSRTTAADILCELGASTTDADSATRQPHYNPATGDIETLWPAAHPPDVHPQHHHPDPRSAPSTIIEPPLSVVLRVAASGDPVRLLQLSDAFGLQPGDAIRTWAAAGLPPELVARTAIAARAGDINAAVGDLDAHWTGPPTDWAQHEPAQPESTAHNILRHWAALTPTRPTTPAPERA